MKTFLAVLLLAVWAPSQVPDFNRDVRPLLSDKCFACHGPDGAHRKAGLRLDERDAALEMRDGRAAIVPGNPARSELLRRVRAKDEDVRMPPPESHKDLSEAEITLLERWIAAGAEYAPHWSFVAPRRAALPAVKKQGWGRGFIDRWVLRGLEERGLAPSPEADRRTLARRLSFDLIGLPPSPEDVDAFVTDRSEGAFERLVNRLLASPHYGERMAMYWLDLVRFADTVGYHGDQEHPIAPYRDWVIDAFNANMPFDRFTIAQLAGDLLPESTPDLKIASGYNRLLQTTHEGGAQDKEYLTIYAADRVRNVSATWMGATLGCAQCHDHKYDPYTARDFYRMAAFFADVKERGAFRAPNTSPTTRHPEMLLPTAAEKKKLARIDAEIARLQALGKSKKKELAGARKRRKRFAKGIRRTMVTEAMKPRVTRVLPRGDWLDDSGEVVSPGAPHFMEPIETGDRRATRLDLARWLVSSRHPQTARVFANRLWYLFFGRGLSSRLDDLGAQGEPPTHPELLDALALELVSSGWDVKHLVRLIVTSSAYRQTSDRRPELEGVDPRNELIARQGRYRVQAEMIRDNALAISGLLVKDVGGDSVKPYQPAGYYRHLNFPPRRYRQHDDARQWRRGVYVHWQRMFLHPSLLAFDAPTREECTAQRARSNTPTAALVLLNDPTHVEAARVFATRILRDGGDDFRSRLRYAFGRTLSRSPHGREARLLLELLRRHRQQLRRDPAAARKLVGVGLSPGPSGLDPVEVAAWTSVARVLLNLGETVTRR